MANENEDEIVFSDEEPVPVSDDEQLPEDPKERPTSGGTRKRKAEEMADTIQQDLSAKKDIDYKTMKELRDAMRSIYESDNVVLTLVQCEEHLEGKLRRTERRDSQVQSDEPGDDTEPVVTSRMVG
jgi:hypothetical protein